jgi:ubiquitin-conjugating enzyme E2 M
MEIDFPDPDDIFNFIAYMEPDEGYYAGSRYSFSISINQNFPHDPPKVKCRHKLYHPNIDKAGNVCLNILREDWKPVLNIHAVIVGLYVRPPSSTASLIAFSSSCSSPTPRTP